MKKIIICLFVLGVAACEKAPELTLSCDNYDKTYLVANYQYEKTSETEHDHDGDHHEEERSTQNITLWRSDTSVAYEYHRHNISASYSIGAHHDLYEIHFFEKEKRAIEYEARMINASISDEVWSEKYQIVPVSLFSKMEKTGEQGEGCAAMTMYEYEHGETHAELAWLSELQIPARFEVETNGHSTEWTLIDIVGGKEEVLEKQSLRDNYLSTDFADIGDNETDPFLRNMINLGFIDHGNSGFYDSEGNDIGGGHAH